MRGMTAVALAVLACAALAGCADHDLTPDEEASASAAIQQAFENVSTPTPLASSAPGRACDSWVAWAASANAPNGQKQMDASSSLRNAVRTCRTVDQFATAVRAHPEALDHGSPDDDEAVLTLLNDTCNLWNKSDSDALTCRDAELRNLIDWESSDYY